VIPFTITLCGLTNLIGGPPGARLSQDLMRSQPARWTPFRGIPEVRALLAVHVLVHSLLQSSVTEVIRALKWPSLMLFLLKFVTLVIDCLLELRDLFRILVLRQQLLCRREVPMALSRRLRPISTNNVLTT